MSDWTFDKLVRLVEFAISEKEKHGINLDAQRAHDVLANFCDQDFPEVDERPLSDYIVTDRDGNLRRTLLIAASWYRTQFFLLNPLVTNCANGAPGANRSTMTVMG